MSTMNRREFLRLSAAGLTALVTGQVAAACISSIDSRLTT